MVSFSAYHDGQSRGCEAEEVGGISAFCHGSLQFECREGTRTNTESVKRWRDLWRDLVRGLMTEARGGVDGGV